MTVAERILLLRDTPPFDRLYDSELGPVAEACLERTFAPGALVAAEGGVLSHLHVVTEGGVEMEEHGPLPPVFGTSALLLGTPLEKALVASQDTGATCLLLRRPHFFTLVAECPWLLPGFVDQGSPRAGE